MPRPSSASRDVQLADFTSLRLGGPARAFVRAGTDDELIAAVRAADDAGEPLLILGGGSNLVVSDDGFDGTVVQVATRGISHDGAPGELTVAAGEDWDALVAQTVAEHLAGLECLSGIPGLAGATPIQNVGAYGQEVADTITAVRVYDRLNQTVLTKPADQCGFGYRTSVFKHDQAHRFVVLGVTFRLAARPCRSRSGTPSLPPPSGSHRGSRPAAPRSARRSSSSAGARAWSSTRPTRTPTAPALLPQPGR